MPVMICNQCFNQVKDSWHKTPMATYRFVKGKEIETIYKWCECGRD